MILSIAMSADPSQEGNKAIVRAQHEEVWSKGKLELVDELYAPDFVCHSIVSAPWHGPEGAKERIRTIRTAFPDWTETIEDIISEGDRVVTRFTSTGTHLGVFMGIEPTGRRVRVAEVAIFRIQDGRIAEQWLFPDGLGLRRQLTEETDG